MSIMKQFGSRFLKACDVTPGQTDSIREVREELVGASQDAKAVIFFNGLDKGLILNTTNARSLVGVLGDDEATWGGAAVKFGIRQVTNPQTGADVDSIVVTATKKKAAAASATAAFDDSVPF